MDNRSAIEILDGLIDDRFDRIKEESRSVAVCALQAISEGEWKDVAEIRKFAEEKFRASLAPILAYERKETTT